MADPKQGGSLADMAAEGTSIPSDAGTQRTIPSVPNPHQAAASSSAGAADNAADIPRSARDVGATGEVVTGKSLPSDPFAGCVPLATSLPRSGSALRQ